MRPRLLPIFVFIAILSLKKAQGQNFANAADLSIVLRSDSTTKSVLVSNLIKDRAGDLSPIIGSANWFTDGNRLECRSFLSFDYGLLPNFIKPEYITRATLVLIPLEFTDESQVQPVSSKLAVRRVIQKWEDSTTNWMRQPQTNLTDEVITRNAGKRNKPLEINVTEIVKNMFRYGNNGFMITYSDSIATAATNWYASAKYEQPEARPMLLINYILPQGQKVDNFNAYTMMLKDQRAMMEMNRTYPIPTAPVAEPAVIVTPPVQTVPPKVQSNGNQ
jgi:hypothetical protein